MQSKLKTANNVILSKSRINSNVKTLHSRKIENPPKSPFIKGDEVSFPLLSKKRVRVRSAFTLVELIVVMTILAIL
jgi:prepilin-type N-terminal cleavage/methylation domain-containing protein